MLMITKTTIPFVKLYEIDFKNSCIGYLPFAEVLTNIILNHTAMNCNAIMRYLYLGMRKKTNVVM